MDPGAAELLVKGAEKLGIPFGSEELESFALYSELLQLWGSKMNLTGRLAGKEIVSYHFLDSLSALPILLEGGGRDLVDIGAGAGFPALPLKICLPNLRLLIVESSRKKVSFCREVVRRLGLREVDVIHGRGEDLGGKEDFGGRFQWAVTRAVGGAAEMAKILFPFLCTDGTAVIFKAALEGDELDSLEEEVRRLEATLRLLPVTVPYLEKRRTLALIQKRST